MAQKMHYLVVRGNGPFPVDMLRYDRAMPATERDSGMIARSLKGPFLGGMSVNLMAMHAATPGRWESFGWEVLVDQAEGVPLAVRWDNP